MNQEIIVWMEENAPDFIDDDGKLDTLTMIKECALDLNFVDNWLNNSDHPIWEIACEVKHQLEDGA